MTVAGPQKPSSFRQQKSYQDRYERLKRSENLPAKGSCRLLTMDMLDQRTKAVRDVKNMIEAMTADRGGSEHVTTAETEIIKHAAVMGAMIEAFEVEWLAGRGMDTKEYLPLVNAQRRLLETVGLKRVKKDVGPTLSEYIRMSPAEMRLAEERHDSENREDDDIEDGDVDEPLEITVEAL